MNKYVFLIGLLYSPIVFGCAGVHIKNQSNFTVSAGFDIPRLREVESGGSIDLELRFGASLHIKNTHQNCMYTPAGEMVIVNFKDKQFSVFSNGKEVRPIICQ